MGENPLAVVVRECAKGLISRPDQLARGLFSRTFCGERFLILSSTTSAWVATLFPSPPSPPLDVVVRVVPRAFHGSASNGEVVDVR